MISRYSIMISVLIAAFVFSAHAQNFSADVQFSVAAPNGRPVPRAEVEAEFRYRQEGSPFRAMQKMTGQTDGNGEVLLSSVTDGYMSYRISHPQFYPSSHVASFDAPRVRPQVTLRPRRDPTPLIAVQQVRLPVPQERTPLGFDLVKMDWLPPHGEGEVEDVRIVVQSQYRSSMEYRAVMQMVFPGPGDGLQPVVSDSAGRRSEFGVDYDAPPAGYEVRMLFEQMESSRQGVEPTPGVESGLHYYIRIRTGGDPAGQSPGLYGRIHGRMISMTPNGPYLVFDRVYINPDWGSRNVEFDPGRNLATRFVVGRWHGPRHTRVELP